MSLLTRNSSTKAPRRLGWFSRNSASPKRVSTSDAGRSTSQGHKRRWRTVALVVVAILVLFAVVGFFVVPPVAKHVLVSQLSEKLHRQVSIADIAVNPFAMTASVRGLVIHERDSPAEFVAFDELFVNLQLESIWRRAPVLREIRLQKPRVHIIRLDQRTFNFSDLVKEFSGKPTKTQDAEPAHFSLNNIQVLDGRFTLDDRVKKAKHELARFNLAVPFISNLDYLVDDPVQPALTGVLNGASFALKGSTKPFKNTLETGLNLDLDGVDVPPYLEYLPHELNFKVESAKLATRLVASFSRGIDNGPLFKLSGRLAITQLSLADRAGQPLLKLPALEVQLGESQPLKPQINVTSVMLRKPEVHVRRAKDGSLSLVKAFKGDSPPADEGDSKPSGKQSALNLTLSELRVEAGQVRFVDDQPATAFRVDLDPVDLTLRNLELPQKNPAQIDLSMRASIGASLQHSGTLMLDPLSAQGTLTLSNLTLNAFAPYTPAQVLMDIKQGDLSFSTRYEYAGGGEGVNLTLADMSLNLINLALNKRAVKDSFFRLGRVTVKSGALSMANRSVSLGAVQLADGKFSARRDQKGQIDLMQLMAKPETPAPAQATVAPNAASTPWTWTLGSLTLEGFRVSFQDDFPANPVSHVLDPMKLRAENLTNRPNVSGKVNLGLGVNKTGKVSASGTLGLTPLSVGLSLDVQKLDLVPLQPYFSDKINILISSGAANLKGSATYGGKAGQAARATFSGDLSVVNLASVDKIASEDFLNWKSLNISKIRAATQPFSLDIAEVALTDFYSRLIIHPDGHLNVQDITAKDGQAQADPNAPAPQPEAASKPPATQAGPPITIGKVTLQGGNINFSDRFIKPNYSANLTEIAGSVTGLSSQLGTTAALELRGSLDKAAPLEITGKVNPLIRNLFLDLKAQVKDIELGPMSPYSGKYVGYAIEKGKLSFDVKYFIENRKLQAENRLVIDQLTFGDKVESKDALSLPVRFAVSLLKDKDGVIDINLPISGSLDDPKFSIGGLIWKVIVNLFQKAVTAPFALIGSLFGGGPELSQITFDVGSHALSKESEDRLAKLAKALTDRPALKLDITGRSDPAVDREGLRKLRFDRQVKSEKLKDLVKRGESAPSVDVIKVEQSEYQKYLTRAYKEAKFPKPRNVIGFVKDLPVPEMEKLMLTHVQVTDDDLLKLATERAQSAKDYLIKSAQVSPERVFLAAPKVGGSGGDKDKPTRADFTLK